MGVVSDPNHLGIVGTLDPKGFTTPKGLGLGPLIPEQRYNIFSDFDMILILSA